MSRSYRVLELRLPRTRGDRPVQVDWDATDTAVPRTRGDKPSSQLSKLIE